MFRKTICLQMTHLLLSQMPHPNPESGFPISLLITHQGKGCYSLQFQNTRSIKTMTDQIIELEEFRYNKYQHWDIDWDVDIDSSDGFRASSFKILSCQRPHMRSFWLCNLGHRCNILLWCVRDKSFMIMKYFCLHCKLIVLFVFLF